MGAWGYEFDDSDQGLDAIETMLRDAILSALETTHMDRSDSFKEHRAMIVTAKRMLEATDVFMDKEKASIFEKICENLEFNMEQDASEWQEPEKYIKELKRDLAEVREWIETLQD